jgi:sugar phosphate isomerase/epimerase
MAKLPVSLQLYTVRDLTAKDFAGSIKEVAKIGYRNVELAGFGNLKTAAEVKKVLDDNGIKVSGAHAAIDQLEKDLPRILDEAESFNNTHLICPYMPEERRKDAAGWKQVAKILSGIGRSCHDRGIDFAYHNHSFEFQQFDGKYGFDILWENSDPNYLKSELDTYWVQHGGADPVGYINKLQNRVLLLHLKDMAPGPDRKFAPVGTGILDFKGIIAAAEKYGVRNGAVEQDNCYETPPLEAIKISFENLKKLGL